MRRAAIVLCTLVVSAFDAAAQTAECERLEQQAAVAVAKVYEDAGRLTEAENQLRSAAKGPDASLRAHALDALARVVTRGGRESADPDPHALGKELARLGLKEKAIDEHLATARAAKGAPRDRALVLLQEAAEESWAEFLNLWWEAGVRWGGRTLVVVGLVLTIALSWQRVRRIRRTIRIMPFGAQNDEASREVAFWIANARAGWRSTALPSAAGLAASYNQPLFELPGLAADLPELEELVPGEALGPIKALFSIVAQPKVRVSGGWAGGTTDGRAYAEIERRGRWSAYGLDRVIWQDIEANTQRNDLEIFAYDVLIRSVDAYVEQ